LSMTPRPFRSVTENPRIMVSAQSGKATGFVASATHRSGQLRSPDLPSNHNHVFSDRAIAQKLPDRSRPHPDAQAAILATDNGHSLIAIFPVSPSPIGHFGKEQLGTDFGKAKPAGVRQRDQGGVIPARRSFAGMLRRQETVVCDIVSGPAQAALIETSQPHLETGKS